MTEHTVNLMSVDAMFAKILIEIAQIKENGERTLLLVEQHDARITTLEGDSQMSKSRIAGAVAALSFVVGAVGYAVHHGIDRFFRS
jgi:hypothetical protein